MSDRGKRAAALVKGRVAEAADRLSLKRETITGFTTAGLPKTTGAESGAVESLVGWELVDALDMLAVGDELVTGDFAGRPMGLGKLRRGAAGPLRLDRKLAFVPTGTTTATAGSAMGTGRSAEILEGGDTAGLVRLTTGATTGVGVLVQLNFAAPRPSTVYQVQLTPADDDADALGGFVDYTAASGDRGHGYVRISCRVAPSPNDTYHWYYLVVGHTAAG